MNTNDKSNSKRRESKLAAIIELNEALLWLQHIKSWDPKTTYTCSELPPTGPSKLSVAFISRGTKVPKEAIRSSATLSPQLIPTWPV